MPIIFICSVPFSGGERVAKSLAQKLGYGYMSREDVVARANEAGIPVGKLEVAMVKRPSVQERMARLKDRYLAVATATICEKAQDGNLVYYGRAGHRLLPGVSHVLRLHVLPEHGQRVETVMTRLKLSREKAEKFLRDIDGDILAWVRFVHGIDMDDSRMYDFVANLENLNLENAATALCGVAELPDFRPTPASQRAMQDRFLQAQARIKLSLDDRTADVDLTVRANDGVLTITYVPLQARAASLISDAVGDLPGCREIRCTMASTNVLWIQEAFKPDSETFREVNELARRWGAAVELLQYKPGDAPSDAVAVAVGRSAAMEARTGGVEDDVPDAQPSSEEKSFQETLEALVHEGRSGGGQRVSGSRDRLSAVISPSIPYSLVVLGDLFLDKPAATRTRLVRELSMFLGDHVKAPVLSTSDLAAKLHLGGREVARGAVAGVLVVLIYCGVFLWQDRLIDLLGGAAHKAAPWFAAVLVALMAPVIAFLYGSVLASMMKWLKMD